MSEEASHVAESPRGLDYRLVVAGVVVVALVALLLVSGPFGSRDRSSNPPSGAAGTAAFEPPPADSEEVTLAMAHAEARAIAMGAVAEAEGMVESVRSSLSECSGVIEQWADLRQALLENEAGRRVASKEETTRRFLAIYDAASPADARIQLGTLQKRLDSAESPLDKMRSAGSSVHAPTGLVESLEGLASDASALAELARGQLRALQALEANTRSSVPAEASLRETMAIVGGKPAQEHAERLRRIVEEGEQARFANLEAQERQRQRLADIASAPRASEILWFVTENPGVYEPFYGRAFSSLEFFQQKLYAMRAVNKYSITVIRDQQWNQETRRRYQAAEDAAKAAFDLTLHDLFRTFMLSERNRTEYVAGMEQVRQDAAGGPGVSSERAEGAAYWLREGHPLPKPTLP